MDFKFSKGSEQGDTPEPAAAKSQQGKLLVLLLILLGGGAYIFFFTDLIRPQQAQQPAPAAPAAEVVKKPLPPRDGEAAKVAAAAPAEQKPASASASKAEPPNVAAAPAPSAPPAEAKKSEQPKAPAPKAASAAKPEPQKAAAAKPEEKKPAVADKKKPEPEKKAAAVVPKEVVKKPAEATKQQAVAGKAQAGTVKPERKLAATPVGSGSGRWTVLVGNYVLEEAMAVDLAKVRKAGLEASVKAGSRKKATMNRLYLAEFTDRAAAQAELDKLKRSTSDAFMLDQGGKHTVYAGSYLLESRAASEKERLAEAGFRLTLKRAEVAIPSRSLTAGTFSDRKAAEEALKKLKNTGLKATLSH